MADELLDAERKNAEWDATFSGTSLAKRRRAQESKAQYEQDALAQQETDLYNRAQTDKTAQDFLFRRATIEQRAAQHEDQMALREKQFAAQQEVRGMQLKAQQAAIDAHAAAEKLRLNQDLRAAETAKKLAEDTDGFDSYVHGMINKGELPGSEKFAFGVLDAASKYSHIAPATRAQWFKEARISHSADEAMAAVSKFKEQGLVPSIAEDANGSFRVTAKPKTSTGSNVDMQRLSHLESQYKEINSKFIEITGTDANSVKKKNEYGVYRDYLQKDALELRKKLGLAPEGGVSVQQNTPAPTSSAVPSQPIPLDKETAASILREAGGDKEKARAIARERGHSF